MIIIPASEETARGVTGDGILQIIVSAGTIITALLIARSEARRAREEAKRRDETQIIERGTEPALAFLAQESHRLRMLLVTGDFSVLDKTLQVTEFWAPLFRVTQTLDRRMRAQQPIRLRLWRGLVRLWHRVGSTCRGGSREAPWEFQEHPTRGLGVLSSHAVNPLAKRLSDHLQAVHIMVAELSRDAAAAYSMDNGTPVWKSGIQRDIEDALKRLSLVNEFLVCFEKGIGKPGALKDLADRFESLLSELEAPTSDSAPLPSSREALPPIQENEMIEIIDAADQTTNADEALVFSRKTSGLVKALSWWDVFLLVIAAPAGSGILYFSVSTAAQYPGGNVAISFAIGMLLVFPVVFIAAVASAIIPRSGSLYVLISRVLGSAIGYVAAVLFYVGYTLSVGVVAFVVVQVLGGILVNAAVVADWGALNTLGTRLSEPAYSAVGGLVLVILTWALVRSGIRAFRNTMRVLFLVTVAAALFTIVYFFALPALGGAPVMFDQVWGPGTYAQVFTIAQETGWAFPGFSLEATLGLLLVVLFSYGGLELVSYASGEVSNARARPLLAGYLGGWVMLALVYILLATSVVIAFGDFLGAYDFVVRNHPDRLEGVMPAISPSVPFYIASVVPNPWIALAVSVGLVLWFVTTMVPYFFAPSRLIFALAMDRAIPRRFADVSERTGAPTTASLLTLAFASLGVLLNLLNVSVVLGTILFCALFVYWLYGLSAMLLPFRRRELYAASPVQAVFAGVPVLSWVGLLAFAVGWFVIFVAVRALTVEMSVALAALMAVSLGLYLFMLRKNQQAGVEMSHIYDQIPPD